MSMSSKYSRSLTRSSSLAVSTTVSNFASENWPWVMRLSLMNSSMGHSGLVTISSALYEQLMRTRRPPLIFLRNCFFSGVRDIFELENVITSRVLGPSSLRDLSLVRGVICTYLTKTLPTMIVTIIIKYDAFAWGCAKIRPNYFLSYILRRRITPKISHFLLLKIIYKLNQYFFLYKYKT